MVPRGRGARTVCCRLLLPAPPSWLHNRAGLNWPFQLFHLFYMEFLQKKWLCCVRFQNTCAHIFSLIRLIFPWNCHEKPAVLYAKRSGLWNCVVLYKFTEFQKNLLFSSSGWSVIETSITVHAALFGLLFSPEDESDRFQELSLNVYLAARRHMPENSGPTLLIRLARTAKGDEYGSIFWVVTSGSTNYTASHNSEDRILCSFVRTANQIKRNRFKSRM